MLHPGAADTEGFVPVVCFGLHFASESSEAFQSTDFAQALEMRFYFLII